MKKIVIIGCGSFGKVCAHEITLLKHIETHAPRGLSIVSEPPKEERLLILKEPLKPEPTYFKHKSQYHN